MKKLLISLVLLGLVFCLNTSVYADQQPLKSSGVLTAAGLVRGYGIDVYRIMFNGTAATSGIGLYDSATLDDVLNSNCKFEIYEATDGEGHYIDFGENPLKFNAGCYISIFDGAAVLHYR